MTRNNFLYVSLLNRVTAVICHDNRSVHDLVVNVCVSNFIELS